MPVNKKLKYKVIAEYDKYYLARSEKGYKECFLKEEYRPDKNGYIVKYEKEYEARELLPPEKINKAWNSKFDFRNQETGGIKC